MKGMIEGFFGFEIFDFVFLGGKENVRLDFHRLPGPVFDPPRRERRDECGLIFPNSGW